jgi:hypothetical protein
MINAPRPSSSLGFISFQRKLNLWLTMGILPVGFLRRPPPLPIFSARRRPFEHRDKKGPAECRAFAS